jgi:ankyrin repeat protein
MGSMRSFFRKEKTELAFTRIDDDLIYKIHFGSDAEVARLLARNANPNATNPCAFNVLSYAAGIGNTWAAEQLISCGAYVNRKNPDGSTPLMMAGFWRGDSREMSVLLLNNGASLNATDPDGNTALMRAIRKRDFSKADLLIERGADVGVKNKFGKTALDLMKSARGKEATELRKLLKQRT